MKNIARYIAVLFCTLTTLTLQAYTLKVKGMPEETLQGMNVGSGVFNPWGDVGTNRYYDEELQSGVSVEAGQSVTLYCYGTYGFTVEKWIVDGVDQGDGNPVSDAVLDDTGMALTRTITFTMPAHDCIVEAWMKYVPPTPGEPQIQKENYSLKVESEQAHHLDVTFYVIKNGNYDDSGFAWRKPNGQFEYFPEVGVYAGDSVGVYVRASSNGWRFSHLQLDDKTVWEGQMTYKYDNGYQINVYTFVMPKHAVTLTAFAIYDPDAPGDDNNNFGYDETPGNPGTNRWTASTGEVFINNTLKGRNTAKGLSFSFTELRNEYQFQSSEVRRLTIVGDISGGAQYSSHYRMEEPLKSLPFYDMTSLEVLDLRNAHHLSLTVSSGDAGEFYDDSGTKITTDMLSALSDYELPSIRKLLLPASLKGFYKPYDVSFFSPLTGLEDLTVYAITPPKVDGNTLDDIVKTVRLYVPEQSVAVYKADAKWGKFVTILPIEEEDAQNITVSLPQDHHDGRYQNMSILLTNLLNDDTKRYVVDEKPSYLFRNIPVGAHVVAQLLTPGNVILAQTDTVIVADKTLELPLGQLRKMHNLSVKVQNPVGTDLTEQVSVVWNDSKGARLSDTYQLNKQIAGTAVYYEVKLPNLLASRYLQPAKKEVFVGKDDDAQVVTLQMMDSITVNGVVMSENGERLAATVTVSQQVNGMIGKSFVTSSDASGRFSLRALSGNVVLSASRYGYVPSRKELVTTTNLTDTIVLNSLKGSVINYALPFTQSAVEGETGSTSDQYTDYRNVNIAAFNETTGEAIDSLSVQYPQIILLHHSKVGDRIRLTASSRKDAFMPTEVTLTIGSNDSATVTIPLKELGGIEASFSQTDNSAVNALLYDNNGLFLNAYPFSEARQIITGLKDGNYTLVVMGDNTMYGKLPSIGEYEAVGLQKGVDYAQSDVTVTSGKYSKVFIEKVPIFNERDRYYTNVDSTLLMLNKSEVGAGSNVTLRSQFVFKPAYKDKISNVRLVVDIPSCGQMVPGSVMTGTKIVSGATVNGSRVTIPIPLEDIDKVTRFIITATDAGILRPQAYALFSLGGREVMQPIGTVSCEVKGITMSVAETISNLSNLYVHGTAPALSYVHIYADGVEVGQAHAQSDGTWFTYVELSQYPNLSKIPMHAVITTPRGIDVTTETSFVTYDQNMIYVKHVYMTYPFASMLDYKEGGMIDFDFEHPEKIDDIHYVCGVHQANPFNFSVEFNSPDPNAVSNVTVLAYTVKGKIHYVNCFYEEKTGTWVGSVSLQEDAVNNIDVTYLQDKHDVKADADALYINHNYLTAISDNISSFQTEIDRLLDVMTGGDAAQRLAALDDIFELLGFDPSGADIEVPAEMTFEDAIAYADKVIANLNLTENTMSDMSIFSADLGERISVGHATGLTAAQLLSEGYEELNTTDGHKIYLLTSEEHSVYVDFSFDIRIEIKGEAAKALSRARAGGGFDYDAWWNGINNTLTLITAAVSDIKNGADMVRKWVAPQIMEASKAITYIQKTYQVAGAPPLTLSQKASLGTLKAWKWLADGIDKIAFCLKDYGINPSEAFEIFSNAPANTPVVKAIQSSAKVIGKIGNVLSYVGLINDIMEGVDKVKRLLALEASVPNPCKDDQAAATQLKKEIGTFIVAQSIWYTALASADIGSLEAMNKGVMAIPITAGYSLNAVLGGAGVALGKMALNYANGIWYSDNVQKYYERINALDCNHEDWKKKIRTSWLAEQRYAENRKKLFKDVRVTIDPSGYVYEAVPDNRVENATTTIYYKETKEDEWGDQHDEAVLWKATEYGQQNPLFTDAEGRYAWDVPAGLWQVKVEKEGFETTYSDWLPVPPPQLDINLELRQNALPSVQSARAYEDVVTLEFNKYMRPSTLLNNIWLSQGGQKIECSVEMQDWAQSYEGNDSYVRRLYLRPNTPVAVGEKLTLTVRHEVESYTGLQMQTDYQQEFTVVSEVRQLGVDTQVEVPLDGERTFSVLAYPSAAAKGRKVIASVSTGYMATVVAVGEFDETGLARITIRGDRQGTTNLTLQLEGTDITTATMISVVGADEMPVATPTASRISGTSLVKGETVTLSCDTEGATIWYTLDGTCPCDENGTRKQYTGPITIDSHTILNVYAVKGDQQESRVATFEYFIIGETGIDEEKTHKKPVTYYTISGQRLLRPQKGINIVQYEDGTTRKIIVK